MMKRRDPLNLYLVSMSHKLIMMSVIRNKSTQAYLDKIVMSLEAQRVKKKT